MERRNLHWERMVRTLFWIVQRMPFWSINVEGGSSVTEKTFGNIVFVDSGAIDFDDNAITDSGDLGDHGGNRIDGWWNPW